MASRQTFLKREPGLARPKPSPVSRPTPATRRPPKKDPRVTPWRPRPTPKPKPGGPLFPGQPKPKYPVFGKRPPHLPLPPTWAGRLRPLRPFLKLHPALTIPFLAWDAWDLFNRYYRPFNITGYRRRDDLECKVPVYVSYDRMSEFQTLCDPIGNTTPVAAYNFSRKPPLYRIFEWWKNNRGRYNSRYPWDLIPGHPGPYEVQPEINIPYVQPDPVELPYPYPFAPMPLPVSPPITRPRDEPYPQPEPQPRPNPTLRPLPYTPPWATKVPVISYEPGKMPLPDLHERRPPKESEREKKKRLKPGTSVAWLNYMDQAIGSYTELDDAIVALYRALPWKLRRWRGRDGVWRDRDIRSDTRAARLYQQLGQVDIEDAIQNLVSNSLSDAAFGIVGSKLKNKAKELGDEGLYQGNTGFQTGGAKRMDTWEEAYEKLKKEQMAKVPRRQYTVKTRLGPGLYRYETRTRPVTQIPWFKQQSLYPRMARPGMAEWWTLTSAEKAAGKKNVKAWYYAPKQTPRP